MSAVYKEIVWVDDDVTLGPFQEALRNAGFTVRLIPSIDEAVMVLSSRGPDLLIWDMSILPHGREFAHLVPDLASDAFGGIPFFHWFRERWVRIPTLLFTSFRMSIPDWVRPGRREFAVPKGEYLPDEFASFVHGLLY